MKRVLIVEDDPDIVALVSIHLRDLNCSIDAENRGDTGLAKARKHPYDLIILDIMLPYGDGVEICRTLRAEKNTTPILMLTAKSEEIDKVLGLETGADDYLTKPFGIREFIARVKALFRRNELTHNPPQSPSELSYGPLNIQVEARKVSLNQHRVELTPKEFALLVLLASRPGRSYSRKQILNQVWGYDFEGYEHTVNSHINRLRSKIEPDPENPSYILTTWGVGYRFSDEL